MIKINRSTVSAPDILSRVDDAKDRGGRKSAAKELRKIKESLDKHIADKKPEAEWSFPFEIYSSDEIKEALEALFHGKCAYCETRYASTQPMDVEHWRPKGQVELDSGDAHKPAYYWLAADWDNLLPSCIDCNRKRHQIDAVTKTRVLLGKEDQFPLVDETARAKRPGDEANETPLLLHPCHDDPAAFLSFGEDSVLIPNSQGLDRRRAETSIRVFALNRSVLVLNRQEHGNVLRLRIASIAALGRLLVDHPDLPAAVVIAIEEIMLAEMKVLLAATKDSSQYAGLARQLVAAHRVELEQVGAKLGP